MKWNVTEWLVSWNSCLVLSSIHLVPCKELEKWWLWHGSNCLHLLFCISSSQSGIWFLEIYYMVGLFSGWAQFAGIDRTGITQGAVSTRTTVKTVFKTPSADQSDVIYRHSCWILINLSMLKAVYSCLYWFRFFQTEKTEGTEFVVISTPTRSNRQEWTTLW